MLERTGFVRQIETPTHNWICDTRFRAQLGVRNSLTRVRLDGTPNPIISRHFEYGLVNIVPVYNCRLTPAARVAVSFQAFYATARAHHYRSNGTRLLLSRLSEQYLNRNNNRGVRYSWFMVFRATVERAPINRWYWNLENAFNFVGADTDRD